MPFYLGLDLGTSGTKTLLFDTDGQLVVGRGSASYPTVARLPGQAEQDPSDWIKAVEEATELALRGSDRSQVRAIGVSGQQHGLVALGKHGRVLRPAKLWCDVTCHDEAAELAKRFSVSIVPSFTAAKLLWMKRYEPENFAELETVLLPHNYINFWLTGVAVMEASDASGTGLMSKDAKGWDWDKVDEIDLKLRKCLPAIKGPNEAVGTLLAGIAATLQLPDDVIVAPGGGDNAMAALGIGAVDPGKMVMSLGTSGTLFGPGPQLVEDPSGVICPFADATGQWLPLLCTINCAGALQQVRASYGLDRDQAERAASAEPAGTEGVSFLPFFGGERTPNWPHATGTILGLRNGQFRPGLIVRAAMEGLTFLLADGMDELKSRGLHPEELRLVGGAARSTLWRQIISDVLQIPVLLPVETEAAALGGALQAAALHQGVNVRDYVRSHAFELEGDVIRPNPALAEIYENARLRNRRYGKLLFQDSDAY